MLDADRYYTAINVSIGVGIAADAVLATIARARTLKSFRDALKWAAAIGMTHWLFPMVGFLGGWYLAEHGGARAAVYGVGGGVLILYVLHVLRERSTSESDAEEGRTSRFSFWLAVWGVSIDALITGPGKAAATAHWSTAQVALSFPFVGIVVFILVLASTYPAMLLHRNMVTGHSTAWQPLARFFVVSTWVEVLVFTWFAILSVIESLGAMRLLTPSYALASAGAGLAGIIMLGIAGAKVWRAQSEAARAMLQA